MTARQQCARNRETDPARTTGDEAYSIHADRIVPVTTAVIIGAGEIGAALARQLAAQGVVSKITLVDDSGTVAQGKALDIRQAGPIDRYSIPIVGTAALDAAIDTGVIVVADHAQKGEWQDDAGVGLIARLTRFNQQAPIVFAGAHQAAVIERAVQEVAIPRARLFGSAPEAFRSAVCALVALEAGCAAPDVNLTVVGRPPDQIIVPWEDAAIAGRRATDVLSPPAITRIDNRLTRLWPPGPMTLAAGATRAIAAAVTRAPRTISALVVVSREEGALGRAGMLPVTLNPRGVERVMTPTLSVRDRVRLATALS
jgi:malate dehydrogenase